MLAACSANVPSTEESAGDAPAPSLTVSPNAQTDDARHGAITGISIGALSGANGALANGVVTAYAFEDKGTIIGVQLNIAAADAGTYYEAWVENAAGDLVSIGKLESTSGDVRHSVRFDTQKNLAGYTKVTVKRERNGEGFSQGEIVANGILKTTTP